MNNASAMSNQKETKYLIDDLEFNSESQFVIIDEIDRLLNTLYLVETDQLEDQESDGNFLFHPDYFDLVIETVKSLFHDYEVISNRQEIEDQDQDQDQDEDYVNPKLISSVKETVDGAFKKRFTGIKKFLQTAYSLQEDLDGFIDEDQIPYDYQDKFLDLYDDLKFMERIMFGDIDIDDLFDTEDEED